MGRLKGGARDEQRWPPLRYCLRCNHDHDCDDQHFVTVLRLFSPMPIAMIHSSSVPPPPSESLHTSDGSCNT